MTSIHRHVIKYDMNVNLGKRKSLTSYNGYRGFPEREWGDGKKQKSYICSLSHSYSMCIKCLSTVHEICLGTWKFDNEIKMFSIQGAMTKINANIFKVCTKIKIKSNLTN